MKKTIGFIFLILIFGVSHAQQNLQLTKIEILKVVKNININYKKKNLNEKIISDFFCENIVCLVCDLSESENFTIKNRNIHKHLKEIISFLNLQKLRKSEISYDEQNSEYLLYYQTAKTNPKTNFEGASALINFRQENGKIKISGIQTIP